MSDKCNSISEDGFENLTDAYLSGRHDVSKGMLDDALEFFGFSEYSREEKIEYLRGALETLEAEVQS